MRLWFTVESLYYKSKNATEFKIYQRRLKLSLQTTIAKLFQHNTNASLPEKEKWLTNYDYTSN